MDDCIFCKIASGAANSWKVYDDEAVYVFLDIEPVSPYHTLVIPKHHYENIFDIPEHELLRVMAAVKKTVMLYNEKLGINHVQIVNSSGTEAQQDVFHIHFHIVPRKQGDGQDIRWTTHPELRTQFDQMLKQLEQD
ncbi:MAG: HIT domain-containing protein [Caldilineaceae bacterium]